MTVDRKKSTFVSNNPISTSRSLRVNRQILNNPAVHAPITDRTRLYPITKPPQLLPHQTPSTPNPLLPSTPKNDPSPFQTSPSSKPTEKISTFHPHNRPYRPIPSPPPAQQTSHRESSGTYRMKASLRMAHSLPRRIFSQCEPYSS